MVFIRVHGCVSLLLLSNVYFSGCFMDYQNKGLKLINTFRIMHRSQPVHLDTDLTEKAEICAGYFANLGKVDHRCVANPDAASESTAAGFIHKSNLTMTDLIENAIQVWYEQESNYRYSKPGLQVDAQDFTKMVWDSSKLVGIGCSEFSAKGTYVVCVVYYTPLGNIARNYAQNVFSPGRSLVNGTQSIFIKQHHPGFQNSAETKYVFTTRTSESEESQEKESVEKSKTNGGKKSPRHKLKTRQKVKSDTKLAWPYNEEIKSL